MNEADTRAEQIDPQLKEAGWVSGGDVRVQREYNINAGEIRVGGFHTGKLKADYVLSYKNRKLAVFEAKSDALHVSEGGSQAKLYAQKLRLETSYAANGKAIYEICLKSGKVSVVARFSTPQQNSCGKKHSLKRANGLTYSTQFLLKMSVALKTFVTTKKLLLTTLWKQSQINTACASYTCCWRWKDVHSFSDCVETVQEPLEYTKRWKAYATDTVSRGQKHLGEPSLLELWCI